MSKNSDIKKTVFGRGILLHKRCILVDRYWESLEKFLFLLSTSLCLIHTGIFDMMLSIYFFATIQIEIHITRYNEYLSLYTLHVGSVIYHYEIVMILF